MSENQKKCYVVRIDDSNGFPISRAEYVGSELGFQVWYKQLQRGFSVVRHGEKLSFPYYFFPVQEG